jgi:hypothetical protein
VLPSSCVMCLVGITNDYIDNDDWTSADRSILDINNNSSDNDYNKIINDYNGNNNNIINDENASMRSIKEAWVLMYRISFHNSVFEGKPVIRGTDSFCGWVRLWEISDFVC